jgi:hypothetical protein
MVDNSVLRGLAPERQTAFIPRCFLHEFILAIRPGERVAMQLPLLLSRFPSPFGLLLSFPNHRITDTDKMTGSTILFIAVVVGPAVKTRV